MKKENVIKNEFTIQIEKFLEESMSIMYKGHDHILARKYYRELFNELIPKYFCICKKN